MRPRRIHAILVSPAVFGLAACNPFDNDKVNITCTTQFVMVTFLVTDASGAPEDSFTISVTNLRTGEGYDVQQPSYQEGVYSAIDDSFNERVRDKGDRILVHGEKDDRVFDAEFVVAGGECHIRKISGPDTVIVADPVARGAKLHDRNSNG